MTESTTPPTGASFPRWRKGARHCWGGIPPLLLRQSNHVTVPLLQWARMNKRRIESRLITVFNFSCFANSRVLWEGRGEVVSVLEWWLNKWKRGYRAFVEFSQNKRGMSTLSWTVAWREGNIDVGRNLHGVSAAQQHASGFAREGSSVCVHYFGKNHEPSPKNIVQTHLWDPPTGHCNSCGWWEDLNKN